MFLSPVWGGTPAGPRHARARLASPELLSIPSLHPRQGAPCALRDLSLRMETLLVTLCKAMAVSQVAQLLGVSDGRVWRTLDHYVDQAHAQEDFSTVTSAGLDETASQRGHNDISLFHDLDAQRVLYACEGRKARVVAQFADALEAHGACAGNSCVVCMDGYVDKLPGWRV